MALSELTGRELTARSVLHRRAVCHELPDTEETVLFDEGGSQLLVLNPTAAAIWYLVDGIRSVAEIAAFLRDHAKGAPEQTEQFVIDFLRDLVKRGAVASADKSSMQ